MNTLDDKAHELAAYYDLDPAMVRDGLHKAIHDGLPLIAAEAIFYGAMKEATGRAPERHYTTEDLEEVTGLRGAALDAELERFSKANPGVTIYQFPHMGKDAPRPSRNIDAFPNPDDPDAALMRPRGIMMLVIGDVYREDASGKETEAARRIFETVAGNGYGMGAWELQSEIMGRSLDDVLRWVRAVYGVYITDAEIIRACGLEGLRRVPT